MGRMTDEMAKTWWEDLFHGLAPGLQMNAAVFLESEFGRARASETDQAETIRALAAVLHGMGSVRRVTAMDEWHLHGCARTRAEYGCDDECEAAQNALRRAGVLK